MALTVGSLFAGIGGFDLAFTKAGFEVRWAVEIDAGARGVLTERLGGSRCPDTVGRPDQAHPRRDRDGSNPSGSRWGRGSTPPVLHADVRECGAHNLPAVDVLVGGWPCQPVSVAGRRRASADERDMWPEFARIASELRPHWVVGENVPGVLSAEGGGYWRRVVDDLAQLGYGVAWRTLDAQNFGVPQRRRRVFVVGCLGDLERAASVLFESEGRPGDSEESDQTGPRAAIGSPGGVAHSLRAQANSAHAEDLDTYIAATLNSGGNNGGFRTEPGEHLVKVAEDGTPIIAASITLQQSKKTVSSDAPDGHLVEANMAVRRLTPVERERLQGFPDGWTDIEGTSDSARYRQLGNAVAVPVVEWIAQRLMTAIEEDR